MTVAQGAGVGGGSLVYANISVEAKPDTFDHGWPAQITYNVLEPHYARVGQTMNVKKVPEKQWPARTKLLKEAAEALGYGDRFRPLELAVTFDDDWTYDQADPHNPLKSKKVVNAQGQTQGTCVHLGDCDIGCEVRARNTLDLNYIPIAEQHGAVVKPLHLVRMISPVDGGYRVDFSEIVSNTLVPGIVTGRLVVVGAGSLGSTELLLQCRDVHVTLPNLSTRLGHNWSSNGDFLTPAFHFFRKTLYPGRGITIAGSIDFLDGHPDDLDKPYEERRKFIIEDGGFPSQAVGGLIGALLRNRSLNLSLLHRLIHAIGKLAAAAYRALHWVSRLRFLKFLRPVVAWLDPINHVMPWFSQGKDAADGRLRLKDDELYLEWPWADSKAVIDAIYGTHEKLAHAAKGWALVVPPITWKAFHSLITPHPLGGCNMGTNSRDGVVDHKGAVFGYPRLYVADGAIVPEALGLNPSKTIAALAERIAEFIIKDYPLRALRS
jgi:cholesterol oxidase